MLGRCKPTQIGWTLLSPQPQLGCGLPCACCLFVGVQLNMKTWDGSGMSQEDFMVKDEVRGLQHLKVCRERDDMRPRLFSSQLYPCTIRTQIDSRDGAVANIPASPLPMTVLVPKDTHMHPLVRLFQVYVYYTQAAKRVRRHSQLPLVIYILSTDNLSFLRP